MRYRVEITVQTTRTFIIDADNEADAEQKASELTPRDAESEEDIDVLDVSVTKIKAAAKPRKPTGA